MPRLEQDSANRNESGESTPGASWWPFLFVVGALLSLVLVPLAIDRSENAIEREIDQVLEPARQLSLDLALVHAHQVARFQSYLLRGDVQSRQRYEEAQAGEQARYDALVVLTRRMQLDVTNKVAALYAKSRDWHVLHAQALASDSARLSYRQDLTGEDRRSEDLLDASNALTEAIDDQLEAARSRMDDARSAELLITIGLVMLALVSTLLVAGIGRRLRALVEETRTQRESAVRARREVNALLEATGDGVLGLDLYGRCTFLNPAGARLLGVAEHELAGRDVHEILHGEGPEGHGRAECPILHALGALDGARAPEDRFRTPDGRVIPVQWTIEPMVEGRRLRGAVLSFTDMREIREAEARLRQAVRARDEVVAVVSHDLRNPLGAIAGASHLLLDLELPPEKQRENLRLIARATERMNRLIGDLLDVARIESGTLAVQKEAVEIQPLFEEAIDMLEPLAADRGLALEHRIDPDVHVVCADRDRILQVLSNLVGNAVKFSRHGAITLGAAPGEEGLAVLSVTDTGPGIPPEARARLFDRFWRADQTDRSGAGLGLAIVHGIVTAHGGRVWVESHAGEGSTFYFTLSDGAPAAPPRRAAAEVASETRS